MTLWMRIAGRMALAAALSWGASAQAAGSTATAPQPAPKPQGAQLRAQTDWQAVLDEARGQTVRFNAWGGDPKINEFIERVAAEAEGCCAVVVEQVKLADTAEAVARIKAEAAAGRKTEGGSVDLIWINGENFAALRTADLLWGPMLDRLPDARFIDLGANPALARDGSLPVDGYEVPWGLSQFGLVYDRAVTPEPPRSPAALADWIEAHPGRFTYPAPPDFIGSAFLKQMLIMLLPKDKRPALMRPVDPARAPDLTAPLWAWLDRIRPAMWREGRAFPPNGPALERMQADGAVDLGFAFHPGQAASAIASGLMPASTRVIGWSGGSIANAHFVAIPANADAKAGAMVFANMLISPEIQAAKLDPLIWGDMTVLSAGRLSEEDRAVFRDIDLGPAWPSEEELGPAIPEPHPSWTDWLEAEWSRRYLAG